MVAIIILLKRPLPFAIEIDIRTAINLTHLFVISQAMVEFFDSFSWSYVHLVSSEGSYGMTGAEAFKEAAKGRVALASAINIPSTGADYDLVVSQLIANQDATGLSFK